MEYNTKLPKNDKGYTVGNRVFETLHQAEIYCNQCDFDPNEMIMHNVESAVVIAKSQMATCEVLVEKLQNAIDKQRVIIEKLVSDRDNYESTSDKLKFGLGYTELLQNKLQENIGIISGLYSSLAIIRNMSTSSMDIIQYNKYKANIA